MIARRLKRKLMISVAIVAVLAGATAAVVMASQPSAHAHRHRAGTHADRIRGRAARIRGRAGHGALTVASAYLGLSRKQLRSELRSGKTLAQIANATSSKSQAGLIEALVAARKAALAGNVKAGTITQAQADKRLPKLASRMTARVERARHARGRPSAFLPRRSARPLP
jgi:hypothetical protein